MRALIDMIASFFFAMATGALRESFWNVVMRNVVSGKNIVNQFDKVNSFGIIPG